MSNRSINVTETSLVITELENNNEYSVYVTASTRFGDGNIKSNMISVSTSEGGTYICYVDHKRLFRIIPPDYRK